MPRKSKSKEEKSTASSKPAKIQSLVKEVLPSTSKPIRTWTEIIQEEINQPDPVQQQMDPFKVDQAKQIQEWLAQQDPEFIQRVEEGYLCWAKKPTLKPTKRKRKRKEKEKEKEKEKKRKRKR